MDIQEEAKEYASGRMISLLEKALEDAYREGYKKGYDNGVKNSMTKSDSDIESLSVKKQEYEGVTFIDMELPSGTLWATRTLDEMMTFSEAQKFSIPSKEQWEELNNSCLLKPSYEGLLVVSTAGNSILFKATEQHTTGKGNTYDIASFWLDEESSKTDALYVNSGWLKVGRGCCASVGTKFKGERLPVMLVKTKE